MKNKWMNLALLSIVSASLLVGCGLQKDGSKENSSSQTEVKEQSKSEQVEKKESKKEEKKEDSKEKAEKTENKDVEENKEVSLENWEGTWNNIVSYLHEPDLKELVSHLAEDHKLPIDEFIKEEEEESLHCQAMKIDGKSGRVQFFNERGGKPVSEGVYRYVRSEEEEHAGSRLHWHVFETDDNVEYPTLIFMEIHGEEALAHFHVRGGKNFEEAFTAGWYPTFVADDTPLTLIIEELEEHEHEH